MEKLATEVQIQAPFITLGQLLKEESIIATGGQAKWFLRENTVLVNESLTIDVVVNYIQETSLPSHLVNVLLLMEQVLVQTNGTNVVKTKQLSKL